MNERICLVQQSNKQRHDHYPQRGNFQMDPKAIDQLFREALGLIDTGDLQGLERILVANPIVAQERLGEPGPWLCDKFHGKLPGFFQRPYLLWFVAEDPIRAGRLPSNIAQMTHAIIESVRRENPANLQEQLDYTLRLVSWSTVARKCGVQIELIDVLVNAGASLAGHPDNALVNGNIAAAEHLVCRGAPLTLATSLCLERWTDVPRLAATADGPERQFALVLAALNGKAEALRQMIRLGVDINAPCPNLYSHGTPLHHAVCSGSLEAVQVLVEAGANVEAQDTAWHGTPLGWALHYVDENKHDGERARYEQIAGYLRQRAARVPSNSAS
jgi:peptide-methionine (S)-S-oxide reductase